MTNQSKVPHYHDLILRMWNDPSTQQLPTWHFSLEDTSTGAHSGFADLGALIKHVQSMIEEYADQPSDAQPASKK